MAELHAAVLSGAGGLASAPTDGEDTLREGGATGKGFRGADKRDTLTSDSPIDSHSGDEDETDPSGGTASASSESVGGSTGGTDRDTADDDGGERRKGVAVDLSDDDERLQRMADATRIILEVRGCARCQLVPIARAADALLTHWSARFSVLVCDPKWRDGLHPIPHPQCLGEDPSREGLAKTPMRVAKSLAFLTTATRWNAEEAVHSIVREALFEEECDDMVVVRDIALNTMCEHHMLPFYGTIHIGYVPNGKVVGLSKLARVTDVFARRLQVQERLTRQISKALLDALGAKGTAVMVEAT